MRRPYTVPRRDAPPISPGPEAVSAPSLFETLSPRERDCLRLVAQGLTSKMIAARLAPAGDDPAARLSTHTVDGYIKTAVGKLGAADRRDAARLLAAHEGTDPRWLGGGSSGVAPPAVQAPPATPATGPEQTRFSWPVRRRGELNNDLSISTRLMWILVLAIGLAVGFGSLASGLVVVADLIGSRALLQTSDVSDHHDDRCDRPDQRPARPGAAGACSPVRAAAR
jgi:DNA-binding CsgD family transcriptional regulator